MKLGKFELDKIYCGDCKDLMKQLPDNSIDLIVTDPPFGIAFMGKKWDTFKPKGAYQYKKGFKQLPRHSTNAMMEFFVPIWKECLRILKDGSFAFIMCSPRQDVLMTQIQALSEAGFNTGFSSIYWTYASGFPKASNIGKMVDKQECKKQLTKKLGRKPTKEEFEKEWENYAPIKAIKKGAGKNPKGLKFDEKGQSGGHLKSEYKERILISPQAQELEGSYGGFQPKPAVEIIIVAMKPLLEKSYIDQALKNRKGITWLDDCKIPYKSDDSIIAKNPHTKSKGSEAYQNICYGKYNPVEIPIDYTKQEGRFPANLLVSDDVLNDGRNYKAGGKYGYGNTKLFSFNKSKRWFKQIVSKGDSGSFSRYFDLDKWAVSKGVKNTFPFLIVPKASKSEKNKGCENLDKGEVKHYTKNRRCKKCGYQQVSGSPCKCENPEWEIIERPVMKGGNIHPTVKPIKLTSYLITLGSRKGDIILDNFCGSGSTLVSAKMLNRRFLGFDTEMEYVEISKARLSAIKYIQEKLL